MDCGMDEGVSPSSTENINGTYEITRANQGEFEVTGASIRNPKSIVIVGIDMTATKEDRLSIHYENW